MKKLLTSIIAMISISLFSCMDASKSAPATATAEQEKFVTQYFEHFNNHDWAKLADMYVEVADFKDPTLGAGIVKQTRQQTIKKYSELHQIFPNLHDKVLQTYCSGEHVIVEFVSTGTAADSSSFELPICTIFTLENGKITKDFTYFDNFEEQ